MPRSEPEVSLPCGAAAAHPGRRGISSARTRESGHAGIGLYPVPAMTSLRIGLVFETFTAYPRVPGEPADAHVEYEPETTVALLEQAIMTLGHTACRLGSPVDLLRALADGRRPEVDVALNIAEGYGSRNREAWAPVLLEMAGIPMLGSDALTLSTSLDKAWTQRLVASVGVKVPNHVLLHSADDARSLDLTSAGLAFPLFVKPRWEGSAKGIRESSKVNDREALAREVARVCEDYQQPALVESFVPGAEFTVAVVGNDPPRALPVLQRALERESGIGLHAVEPEATRDEGARETGAAEARASNGIEPVPYLPGTLTEALERELYQMALRVFRALECLDFARLDFRLDAAGQPVFLEINPLPTFAADGTFAILAELEGRSAEAFLGEILAEGLRRLGWVSERGSAASGALGAAGEGGR